MSREEIRLTRRDAQELRELYMACRRAEKSFLPCQGASFRSFILTCMRSPRILEAIGHLEQALTQEETRPRRESRRAEGRGRGAPGKEEQGTGHSGGEDQPEAPDAQ